LLVVAAAEILAAVAAAVFCKGRWLAMAYFPSLSVMVEVVDSEALVVLLQLAQTVAIQL